MCAPVIAAIGGGLSALGGGSALAGLGTAASILGTVATVTAGVSEANSAKRQAEVEQKVAQNNVASLKEAAQDTLAAGQEASDRKRRMGAAVMAQQKAAMAANGIDVGSNDAISILNETAQFTAEDAFSIRKDSARRARDLQTGAKNEALAGQAALNEGNAAAFRSILTTAATVGSKYSNWVSDRYR